MTSTLTHNLFNVVRKFGFAGFIFFFVKGLLWLAAPFIVAWFI